MQPVRRNIRPPDELHGEVTGYVRERATWAVAIVAALAAALTLAPAAHAAAPLSWSAHEVPGAGALRSVSCPTGTLCVAVGGSGEVFASGDPLSSAPAWSEVARDTHGALDSVSCASVSLCVAAGEEGQVAVSTDPARSWSFTTKDGTETITSVSCPAVSLCVAVDVVGDVLTSTDPSTSKWSKPVAIDSGTSIRSVSCANLSACLAVDGQGQVLASTEPTVSGSWRPTAVTSKPLESVSCPTGELCIAVDAAGSAFASGDAFSAVPTWSATDIDTSGSSLAGVSCVQSGLCVALDGAGQALASDDPLGFAPGWSSSFSGGSPRAVSCLPQGFCVAVDSQGQELIGRLPAPSVQTGGPSSVTPTDASVSGMVNPEDAPLSACRFEYGVSASPYTANVPCETTPGPGSAGVSVAARLSGLEGATTYHYRLYAATATGESAGADGTFTTAAAPSAKLIYPNPYITGIPANGDRLACNPGLPSGAKVSVAYQWWRDDAPIEGAEHQLYRIEGQDATHHLQCEAIATNEAGSASRRSAFVTVPAEGIPVSAGETAIGLVRTNGHTLEIPVDCSPDAYRQCKLDLHLSAFETVRGKKVLAVTARKGPHHPPPPPIKRRSVTLLARRASVPAGRQRTVVLPLSRQGQRMVAKAHRASAQLTVEGTVIGVLTATLLKERVSFGAGASAHAGHQSRRSGRVMAAVRRVPATAGGVADGVARMARNDGHDTASVRGAQTAARAVAAVPHATPAPLTPTPYMGWDSYLALGPRLSESAILAQASAMVADGLKKDGYRYVWLDVGWWQGQRNAKGEIVVNSSQWPHGMAWLAATLHHAGLLVGLYTDAGSEGCGGPGQGSYGHYQQDANTFASWGFDAVKVDFCGGGRMQLSPANAYHSFHQALTHNSSHRPMLLSICNFREPQSIEGEPSFNQSAFASYSFGPSDGNSWRTSTDIGFPGFVTFPWVLRNLDAAAAHPDAAGPGHWNDPDYLAPDQGLTDSQFRAQMSMWAMIAAPLMASDNLTTITQGSLRALENREVIAIDQDPAGIQGKLVASSGNGEVWVKPLYGGARAVALLNRDSSAVRIATSARAIGMGVASGYTLRDLWAHATTTTSGQIAASVPAESAVMYKVSANH